MMPSDSEILLTFIKKVAAQVEQTIQADLAETLNGNDPLLAEVLSYALLGGGKRVRPMLAIICSRLCGRDVITSYSIHYTKLYEFLPGQ